MKDFKIAPNVSFGYLLGGRIREVCEYNDIHVFCIRRDITYGGYTSSESCIYDSYDSYYVDGARLLPKEKDYTDDIESKLYSHNEFTLLDAFMRMRQEYITPYLDDIHDILSKHYGE